MNKKGFTVIEVLTTFVLISIVVSLLISIVNSLVKIYNSSSIKTELYYKQSIISKDLNDSFLTKSISRINSCGTNCITIVYFDSSTKKIQVEPSVITVGDNIYDIVNDSKIGDVKMELVYSPLPQNYKADTLLNIRIPISHIKVEGDYGINLVYQFNRGIVEVSV